MSHRPMVDGVPNYTNIPLLFTFSLTIGSTDGVCSVSIISCNDLFDIRIESPICDLLVWQEGHVCACCVARSALI